MAPQGRLTEFKAYVGEGVEGEEQIQNWAQTDQPDAPQISLASLSDLLPLCIARDLSERPLEVAVTPSSQQIQAACLFLDISQFTAISEFLSSDGMRGPERLAQHINQLFTQLLRVVGKAGGDIFKFAGDAVIVLWPVDKDTGEDLQQVARRAVQCACDVQETLPKMEIPGEKKFSLAFKCGVGVGNVCIVHLGGGRLLGLNPANGDDSANNEAGVRTSTRRVQDPRTHSAVISSGDIVIARREYVAVGDPLKQAFSAEKLASRNDIIVSRQTWSLVSEHFTTKMPKSGKHLPEGFVLIDEKGKKDLIKKKKPRVTVPPQKEWMLTYVPRSAHLFLEVEHHTRKDWVSELRRVTVLFINMGVPKQELATILTKHEGTDRLHEYFCAVQRAVLDYEGSINKFLMDDKGSTVIAVFGLPPISHENDATRGVLASLAISVFLQEMGAEPAVGVATGIAFCGVVGHPGGRREYTVLGDIVNLSARLMQRAAEKQEGVLTDSETYYQAQEQLEFNYLKQIQVKGKTKRVDVWQPHTRGFKTKRTLIGKALGVKKHRRRPSLDGDWKDQVSHVTDKSRREVLGDKEAESLKRRMEQFSDAELEREPSRHHEDERNLASDSFDEMIVVMSRMYRAVLGKLPLRDRLESKDSSDGAGYNDETKRSERRPRSVVIEGSIGTGKSRLLSRLSDVLSLESTLWILEATCNPFERGALARPFGLFVTLISTALVRVWNETKKDGLDICSTLDEVPVAQRRAILLRWLALGSKTDSNYLLNDDFGVDFEEPVDMNMATSADSAENLALIGKKAQIIQALFDGMAQGRRIVLVIDDAVHLDRSSWQVALSLAANGPRLGEGVCMILASRPVADFVLIDANSRGAYTQFRQLHGVLKETVPLLPPRSVRRLACDLLQVSAISPEIELALDKCQGNPLFVRELIQSMQDTPDVLDVDVKNNVVSFGKAAACKLHDKALFPICERCNTRLPTKRSKVHCFACGRVMCTKCCPESNKRFAVGYKEAVRTCLDCSEDVERHRRVTADAIVAMNLDPPVAIVCVIGTWIDKLTIPQQMVLKVACLLQRDMRFEKTQAFEAYPLDAGAASFELEFDALIALGFVRQVNSNVFATAEEEDVYEFCHNFLPDVLNQRVLSTQREELENHINEARSRREEHDRQRFMTNKGNNLASLVLKEGYLMVLKRSVGSNRMAWKQRWGVIVGHRLEFYHERGNKTFASACDLRSARVSSERGLFAGRLRVIRVQVPGWEKGGKIITEKRDFFISPELCTDPEHDQWVYFLKMAIEANTVGGAKAAVSALRPNRKSISMGGGWFGTKKKSDASSMSRKSETEGGAAAPLPKDSGNSQERGSTLQFAAGFFTRKSNMKESKDLMRERPGDEEAEDEENGDGSFEVAGPSENGSGGGVLGSLFGRKSNLREAELVALVAKADAAAEED